MICLLISFLFIITFESLYPWVFLRYLLHPATFRECWTEPFISTRWLYFFHSWLCHVRQHLWGYQILKSSPYWTAWLKVGTHEFHVFLWVLFYRAMGYYFSNLFSNNQNYWKQTLNGIFIRKLLFCNKMHITEIIHIYKICVYILFIYLFFCICNNFLYYQKSPLYRARSGPEQFLFEEPTYVYLFPFGGFLLTFSPFG